MFAADGGFLAGTEEAELAVVGAVRAPHRPYFLNQILGVVLGVVA